MIMIPIHVTKFVLVPWQHNSFIRFFVVRNKISLIAHWKDQNPLVGPSKHSYTNIYELLLYKQQNGLYILY